MRIFLEEEENISWSETLSDIFVCQPKHWCGGLDKEDTQVNPEEAPQVLELHEVPPQDH